MERHVVHRSVPSAAACIVVATTLLSLIALQPDSAQAQSESTADSSAALADLVIAGFDMPLRIRLLASSDGQPWGDRLQAAQQQHLQRLFEQLDGDSSGELSHDEARRIPASQSLFSGPDHTGVYVAFNFRVLDRDRSGQANFEEFCRYIGTAAIPPVKLTTLDKPLRLTSDVFTLLDEDRNGNLAREEWEHSQQLWQRDRSGNGVLTPDELLPRANIYGPEFIAAPIGRSRHALSVTIQQPQGDACIELLAAFNRSGNDHWVLHNRPDCGVQVQLRDEQTMSISQGERRVTLRLLPDLQRRETQLRQALRRQYEAIEQRAQEGETDLQLPPQFKYLYSVADANLDGRVDRQEFAACLDSLVTAWLAAESAQLELVAFPMRRDLAGLIDDNVDGRISRRELDSLPDRINDLLQHGQASKVPSATEQAVAADGLAREAIPATMTVVLRRGATRQPPGPELLLTAGPPWFYRSDFNQDGDLSSAEFLGSKEDFIQIDLDGDGQITLSEAVAFDHLALAKQQDASSEREER